ncbi:MAG: putative trifunctional 2-polyprenylphenol hydroxylase/glutamate synthase subunit beta/ferritin domain-containing protein [Betaproteobacteria bacterium ADurb.Bin341]|nr:MAG: putative trifunctional 2-polyprenylphenol hydroxylase/glutamate synthase subunit beta/ferritin domain-containing protein [Betaproteobacteria bacterium ADurb.Bin341]
MDQEEIMRLFNLAIKREVEANAFYTAAAARVKDENVRTIFKELAGEELDHMALLEGFREDPTLQMKMAKPDADYKLAEETELPELTVDMRPTDAIALAMKKEQQALEFYKRMAASCSDAGLKDVFENLSNMELGHKHRLEDMFVNISFPESF